MPPSNKKSKLTVAERISKVTQQWFLTEPLLFGAWTTHQVGPNKNIDTIRVGRGKVEYCPEFIEAIADKTLHEVMKLESLRIILKHPYQRKKPNLEFSLTASNLAIGECGNTILPMPTASGTFETEDHNQKYFEYYYNLLVGTKPSNSNQSCDSDQSEQGDDDESAGQCKGDSESDDDDQESNCKKCGGNCKFGNCQGGDSEGSNQGSSQGPGESSPDQDQPSSQDSPPKSAEEHISKYCDAAQVCVQNAHHWDEDQFLSKQINDVISEIESSNNWGTVGGCSRELILASRNPKLDYRKVLKSFRANVLSTNRTLTRMKPSRRYGFQYLGSRRDFATHLLFAVDVSGSVSTADVQNAFSIVNRLFKYGIESIDVVWFDTEIRNKKPLTIKKARKEVAVVGRGGTAFQPLIDYIDIHRNYDGLIIFTDGIAPIPVPPKRNRRTRVAWLFNTEENWKQLHKGLQLPGMVSAFVYSD